MIEGIGIVSQSRAISLRDTVRVAAAVQTQVLRDLYPSWGIAATVSAFFRLEDVPLGHWPVLVRDELDPLDAGIHQFEASRFGLAAGTGAWSEAVSALVLDLLVNPDGTHRLVGPSPETGQGEVEFVVAVASGGRRTAPEIHGYPVSELLLPAYYQGGHGPYSSTGTVAEPHQVERGGALTWWDGNTGRWWQRTHNGDGPPEVRPIDIDADGDIPRQLARRRARLVPPYLDIDLRAEPGSRPTGATHRARRLNDVVNGLGHQANS
ncbi:MAG: hypothetical protein OES57_08300 [Acidimicrobiia bacterium]|nr:hypothetical protein [Acidimicrobiia bacterium]